MVYTTHKNGDEWGMFIIAITTGSGRVRPSFIYRSLAGLDQLSRDEILDLVDGVAVGSLAMRQGDFNERWMFS